MRRTFHQVVGLGFTRADEAAAHVEVFHRVDFYDLEPDRHLGDIGFPQKRGEKVQANALPLIRGEKIELPEVEVGIVSVAPSPFGGLGPAEISLVAPYFHAAYLQAEREGYDAAVPLGTLDLGVDGGRSLVDIPIVGPCEAMFHIAAQLGERFGIICYHESVIPRQITQTRYYGMEP